MAADEIINPKLCHRERTKNKIKSEKVVVTDLSQPDVRCHDLVLFVLKQVYINTDNRPI